MPTTNINKAVSLLITSASNNFILIFDPAKPPIITAPKTQRVKGIDTGMVPLIAKPVIPPIELTKIKKLAIPAIFFASSQFNKLSTGDKNMPPPIPTRPDKKPKAVPNGMDLTNIFFLSSNDLTGRTTWKNNATAESTKAVPNKRKKVFCDNLNVAAHNAAGTLKMVYGIALLSDKNPLR